MEQQETTQEATLSTQEPIDLDQITATIQELVDTDNAAEAMVRV